MRRHLSGIHLLVGAVAVAAVGVGDSLAQTSDVPLALSLWAGGELVWSTNQQPQSAEGTVNFYNGDASGEGWGLSWDVEGDPDPFVIANTAITNMAAVTQNFQLMVTLPVFPALTPSSLIGGSVQGGITADGDGGTLSSITGTSIYQAMIDGSVIGEPAALLDDPSSVSAGAFLSNSFTPEAFGDMPMIPSEPGPAVLNSIGILLSFSLTAGDQATFSSVFVAEIPSPAPLALFGAAGLVAARRRR